MVLRVAGLAKRFGPVTAVADVSLAVGAGEVLGLLGANGAGKTTAVDCILGLLTPDAGTVTICGLPPREARAKFGAVLQATGLPGKITPHEAIEAFSFLSSPRTRGSSLLLERFGLSEKANACYDTLSGGQQQRLALALAFIGDPRLLVLDEPTAGLDIQARRSLHDDIRAARAEGRAVLLTTHDMAEAKILCDRIAVMRAGRIVAAGTPDELAAGGALEDVIAGLSSENGTR
jgi:ABC-2 type transport system ATP-binding protein